MLGLASRSAPWSMISFGFGIGSSGASSARPMISTSHAIAIHAPRPNLRRAPDTTATTSGGTATSVAISSGMTDPRVEHRVEQVDDEVHQHVATADHCDARRNRELLPLGDPLEDGKAAPGSRKDA